MSEPWADLDSAERELLEALGVRVADLRAVQSTCPPPELLRARSEDVLPEDLRARIDRHMADCTLCRILGRDLAELSSAHLSPEADARIREKLPSSSGRAAGAQSISLWASLWRPLVATAALAVVAIFVFRQGINVSPVKHAPEDTSHAQSVSPQETMIPIEKPGVKLTASALLLRGSEGDGQKFLGDLAPALDAYRKDNYAEASQRLSVLANKYPKSVEVSFFLGICRIYTKDNSGAVAALEAARKLADETFASDVAWYLMLAHQRNGQKQTAEAERQQICSGSGPYAARACQISIH